MEQKNSDSESNSESQEESQESKSSRKRKAYSIEKKLEAADYANKYSKSSASRKFGVGRTQIINWVNQEEKLRQEHHSLVWALVHHLIFSGPLPKALQCSGHGDCTTTQRCLCYDGWAGSACDIRSNQSRRIGFATIPPVKDDLLLFPSFKVGKTLETSTLLGILLLVGIFLLLLLVCLLFCYRRKSSNSMHEDMMHEKVEDESLDVGNRAIKFGQMPSYREEKRKRKKNKRVYDALQRINEAAEERDSVSLKSRESSLVTQAAPAPQHQQSMTNGNAGRMDGRPAGFNHKQSNDSIATAMSSRHHHQQNNDTSLAEYDHHHNHANGTSSSSRFLSLELNRDSNNSDGMYIGSSHTLSPTSVSHPLDMAYSSNPMNCLNGSSRRQQQPTSRKLHYLDRGGYATDSELLPMSRGNGILSQSDGMECPMTPPLRLQSIQHLLKRLNPEDKMMQNMGDCEDSDRGRLFIAREK
uniref:EGF-like domain-containing protein n=1 Tax=Ditylenchus dipsaci TaxID=166011 RepID=A0A915D5K1_9BILA